MYKKIIVLMSAILLILPSIIVYADDEELETEEILNAESIQTTNEASKEPKLNSRGAAIYDRTSKEIIYGKEEKTKRKMASTTKIMTAIVVIEKSNLMETIEVSKKAAGTGGSRLGLKTGDKITVNDLLYGLMLCSGNDAAVTLAENVGGSIEGFAKLMNDKADELGLQNTNFVTPHGLDSDEHYTTAYELAQLADYALKNEKFASIVKTKNYTININGNAKFLSNTNELLGTFEGVYGVKTGFTNGANRCLVTAIKKDGLDIITVVLGADTKKYRTADSIKLINYACNNYKEINIKEKIYKEFEEWKSKEKNNIIVDKGIKNEIELEIESIKNEYITIKKEDENKIEIEIENKKYLEAPISKKQVIGKISVNIEDENKQEINVLVKNEVKRKNIFEYFKQMCSRFTKSMEECL